MDLAQIWHKTQKEYKKMPRHEGGARFGTMIRGGFEPSTVRLEGECSIQLSYRTKIDK